MKSKPVYGSLGLDMSARRHLFVAQGNGCAAVRRALEEGPEAVASRLLYTPDPSAPDVGAELEARGELCVFPDPDTLIAALETDLSRIGMETAFYVAGPERFLWQVTNRLREAGIGQRRIQQELAGSKARSVYCVHCRTINEGVTTTIHRCAGCGMALTVRDHFSRPLGAYMGVIVDAETPGLVPEPETLYV